MVVKRRGQNEHLKQGDKQKTNLYTKTIKSSIDT